MKITEDKLSWCLEKKKGIRLSDMNNNLSSAYFSDADDSLLAMERNEGKWKIITAYYACYNALYAILMKAGIECEIHDCTLNLMQFFDFNEEQKTFMDDLKKMRIGVQYYLEKPAGISISEIKSFVLQCKKISAGLDADKINKIRGMVKNG